MLNNYFLPDARTFRGVRNDEDRTQAEEAKLLGLTENQYKCIESGRTECSANIYLLMLSLHNIEDPRMLKLPKIK